MDTAIRNATNTHWNLLKHLDDNTKIDLIMMLSLSLKHRETEDSFSAKRFYGCWGDDGMSAEEFVDELKNLRSFNKDIIEL